jgi:SprT-like family protein
MSNTTPPKYPTREQWLLAAVEIFTPLFTTAGYKVPKVRVTCGWPSAGGLKKKGRTIGQCWDADVAADNVHQIFISPVLEANEDECGVIPTLIHEVVHAVVGIKEKHNKVFKKCAHAVGLTGKMTSTEADANLLAAMKQWSEILGVYPHAKLDPKLSPVKKQSARMVKMECKTCGYIARTAKKWLQEVGPCLCPAHGVMVFEIPEPADEDGDDGGED